MKITDEMVEAAWSAWMDVKKTPDDEYNEDDMRAAIAAALNAAPTEAGIPATGVTVKPLEWVDHPAGGKQAVPSGLCRYRTHRNGDDWYLDQDHMGKGGQDAAFDDYSARIMSAIEPAGVGVDPQPWNNDTIWARFYRDGKTLGEICEEFKCGIYDLSPWLTAPLVRAALKGDE